MANRTDFVVDSVFLKETANQLMPAMIKGFVHAKEELIRIQQALSSGELKPESIMKAILTGKEDEILEIADRLKVLPDLIIFVFGHLMKPFIENMAETIVPLSQEIQWSKGYCPICGSWPGLAFLKEESGKRWLRCSFCGQQWSFPRTVCPFCENDDQYKLQYFSPEDRKVERAEVCLECRKYLICLDLRECSERIIPEVASIAALYLDILLQEKGFWPSPQEHGPVFFSEGKGGRFKV